MTRTPAPQLAFLAANLAWCAALAQAAPAVSPPAAPPPAVVPGTPAVLGAASVRLPSLEGGGTLARGVVKAVGEATISSRMAARITELPLQEGRAFAKGEVLVAFDCERLIAEARAADAAVVVQQKVLETNEELDRFSAIGKNELMISRAQLDKAKAEAEALNSHLKECKLLAPFSGRVMERMARAFEAVQISQPLLRIADTSELELDLIVPSQWLAWLRQGSSFNFRTDETGQVLPATVLRIGAAVDPVSKTVRIAGGFSRRSDGPLVLPGMSGTATFAGRGR